MTNRYTNQMKIKIGSIVVIMFTVFFAVLLVGIYYTYNGFQTVDITDYSYDVPDTLNCHINYVDTIPTHTYIYGWIYSDAQRFSYPTVILYDTKDKTYHKLVTTSVRSSELFELYGEDYENAGFVATVDNQYLTSEYQIMLTYPCGNKELLITTDHYVKLEESNDE